MMKTRMTGWDRRGAAQAVVLVLVVVVLAGVGGAILWGLRGGGASAGATIAGPVPEGRSASIEASLDAARQYLEANEAGRAEAVLTSAVGQYPDDAPLRLALAEVLLHGERGEEAYAQFEAALAIDADDPEIHFAAGTLASTIGRLDRAIEHYSMARSASPSDARFALFLAAVQLEAGDREEAKVNFLHALHLDPTNASPAAALAQVALDDNDRELALNYARRAREIQPEELAYLVLEARALRRLGRAEEALAMILALPDEQLYLPGVMTLAGECLGLLRRPGDAAELYADAAQTHPGEAVYAFEAALWYERAGDTENAKAMAMRAKMLGHEQASGVLERLG